MNKLINVGFQGYTEMKGGNQQDTIELTFKRR